MPHYLSMYDSRFLHVWDLGGRDWTLTIARVTGEELTAQGGRKSKKPVVYFRGATKGLALNKTNGAAIAGMYGVDTKEWIGKAVTLYGTQTEMSGRIVECIRVRPRIPGERPAEVLPDVPVDEAMLQRQHETALAAAAEPRHPVQYHPTQGPLTYGARGPAPEGGNDGS